jgi:hypothetical protein
MFCYMVDQSRTILIFVKKMFELDSYQIVIKELLYFFITTKSNQLA